MSKRQQWKMRFTKKVPKTGLNMRASTLLGRDAVGQLRSVRFSTL